MLWLKKLNRMDSFCQQYNQTIELQKKLDAPMPWIGVYIAAASVACFLAMTLDGFNGFRLKKIWLPCKYFSLNAFSLTLLAVTVKLPLDLTSNTLGHNDKIARMSSLVLISTCMGNFMASLGSMEDSEVILNLAALAILVITVAVNVFIHNFQISSFEQIHLDVEILPTVLMLLLLVNMCCMAIMVPSAKRYIESKYNEMHKRFSNEEVNNELKVVVRRYWVMAATSSPQFVMARSAISATSGVMCLAMATVLAVLLGELHFFHTYYGLTVPTFCVSSNYGWSIKWILHLQVVGVVFGSVAPLLRWYVASWFKFLELRRRGLMKQIKIEKYWTSKLVEWRESSLSIQIRQNKCRKLHHGAKTLVLNICIGFQYLVVLINKTVIFFFAYIGVSIVWCFCGPRGSESTAATYELDLRPFVLLLEGETQLPDRILKNICNEVDKFIQIGENKQLNNLIKLLKTSANFNGVREFDSSRVRGLHSPEPPNCWSLPVATLTSIALALPNVTSDRTKQLLSGVSEGLNLINLMEKTHDRNGQVKNIRDAADMVWVGVELYRKWLHNDLQNIGTSRRNRLENLSSIAKRTVKDFLGETEDILKQNPLLWPANVIAANSMYRVTQTLLLDRDEWKTNEEVFSTVCVIISDILAACLTNLDHVIRFKCCETGVKEREQSVKEAATLLGESQRIRQILEQRGHPPIEDAEHAINIDKWRA